VTFFRNPVVMRDSARRASIADWFLGEDVANRDRIDISRLQMVLITAGLLVTYGEAICGVVRDLSTASLMLTVRDVSVLIASLPPVGTTMAVMLAASHATYLIAKAADGKPAAAVPKGLSGA
jgi:hypothetical protein